MKIGSACVRALLWRKRCVHHRVAKVVLFVATRVCPLALPARCYSGSRDQVTIDQDQNTLASMEKWPFPVYRRCGDVGG